MHVSANVYSGILYNNPGCVKKNKWFGFYARIDQCERSYRGTNVKKMDVSTDEKKLGAAENSVAP